MNQQDVFLKELALLRLETHFVTGDAITAQSSFPSWLQAACRHVGALHVVLPLKATQDPPGSAAFVPRPVDRVYGLPDCRGYLRAFLALPVIIWRLLQVRRRVSTIVVRVPEHLNALLLPLLWLLRFNIVVWLVADREEIRIAEQSRRKPTPLLRLAFAFAAATGFVERVFLTRSRVVANGSALFEKVARLGADQTRMCRVVSSSLRAADMPSIVRRQEPASTRPAVLYVGRLSAEKGVADLLSAIPEIKRRCSEAGAAFPLFRFVGWGAHGEEERLTSQVEALGIAGDVVFAGRVPFGPRLFTMYETSRLCVLPSWSEGTPRVLVEAMAFGLPVVATHVGGIPDVIEDGQNGILVPPRNSAALAASICELLVNEPVASRMSELNLRKARELSVENVCRRFLSFVAPPD